MARRIHATAALVAAASVLAACGDPSPRPSAVTDLRVLAIRADPPEVRPGDTVALETLVVDAEERPIDIRWFACAALKKGAGDDLDIKQQSPTDCAYLAMHHPDSVTPLGEGPTASLTVPEDWLSPENIAAALGFPPGTELPPVVEAAITAIAGINIHVAVVATAGEQTRAAGKRVNVSRAATPNLNPTGLAIVATEEAADTDDESDPPRTGTPPGERRCLVGEEAGPVIDQVGRWRLTPVNTPLDEPVAYEVIVGSTDPDNPIGLEIQEEAHFYSFFSTVGSFGDDIVQADFPGAGTSWDLPEDTEETLAPLWIVLRDGRGGTDWCTSQVALTP